MDNTELLRHLARDSSGEISETLHFLLEECSLDDAPTREEAARWHDILTTRGSKFADAAQMCRRYLDETA